MGRNHASSPLGTVSKTNTRRTHDKRDADDLQQ